MFEKNKRTKLKPTRIKAEANAIVKAIIRQQKARSGEADTAERCKNGQVTKSVGWMPWH